MTKLSIPWRNMLIGLGLVLAVTVVYWPVRHFEFTNFDDDHYVSKNPQVERGLTWQGVAWAFTTRHAGNWHPMTWLSHMLDCQLFGLKPGGHHVVNVLLHIANSLMLFGVFQRMTRAPWRSALVAALFALHPLHVESVAWIAERKDVLSAFFWMLTLGAYIRYVETRTAQRPMFNRYYSLAVLFFAFGLMTKPMLVTLPFVLLLLDYWPLGRTRWAKSVVGDRTVVPLKDLLLEKLPFFGLTVVACAVTFWAQSRGGTIEPLEYLPLSDRLENATVGYLRYLGKAFWPVGLAVFYPLQKWELGTVVGAVLVLSGILAWVIWKARSKPQYVVGSLWYLGTLVPVIGLVQAGGQSMADRYTYLPLIGVFIMLAWSLPVEMSHRLRIATAVTAAILLSVGGALTRRQLSFWQNSVTLFEHSLAVTGPNFVAHYNLGFALAQAGKVEEAIAQFQQALQFRPDSEDANYSMGLALFLLGRTPETVTYWEQALRIRPDDAVKHYDLGNVLSKLHRVPKAIEHFDQAIRIKPDYVEALNNLAWLLATVPPSEGGSPGRAVVLAEQACALTTNKVPSYLDTLAAAYASAGQFDKAVATAENAVKLASSTGQSAVVRGIESRLELYRDKKPYRLSLSEAGVNEP